MWCTLLAINMMLISYTIYMKVGTLVDAVW